jgi:hypothetical protein
MRSKITAGVTSGDVAVLGARLIMNRLTRHCNLLSVLRHIGKIVSLPGAVMIVELARATA